MQCLFKIARIVAVNYLVQHTAPMVNYLHKERVLKNVNLTIVGGDYHCVVNPG